ncbi:polyketide synthase [Chroococcidiopsis sp. CCALA 051]|uniref:type I polyketide synthase n=1 Tax=Chroococcidiopsis sp. CCALA 051 TaxID=869949 RepID=UPI000D0DC703|nr:type I polyketide synthase [Chroococcidiopsis sp. CCALA 051]PSM49382.1 polyketide synthase [Chroococcidiopsis sp. CCALA 051]
MSKYSLDSLNQTDIAIIGMSCRFPGADNPDAFWQNLRDGVESISVFSDRELLSSGVDSELLSHPNYVKAGGVLPDIELFDAAFFDISAREAEILDPQQRLFLENAWTALESAGYDAKTYSGSIGVYAGVGMNTYLLHNLYANLNSPDLAAAFQLAIANDKDFLPTRISYKLNLKGPSVNVQTACSTSLVAVHLACQSLLNGECDMALAGGVSIRIPQKVGYLYQEGMILSPDGHCRAFDAQAQGTIGSSGLGIVVLKRLEDAIADGDCIHAAIKGSAINNDGAVKVGYTAPSVDGQASAIAEAQAIAGVAPDTVTYIAAHGTGTPLGDPIEIAALTQAFATSTQQKFCAIGSVKTNFGHLDAAAGVASLIETVLALKHKQIPPSLHFEQPNPEIDFTNSPFYVNTQLQEWKTNGIPRRAGVSSFGIGGTNAHVVVEEAPGESQKSKVKSQNCQDTGERPCHLLCLSAKTANALEKASANLAHHLGQHPEVNLADVAYTLAIGRQAFDHRRTVVVRDGKDAVTALESAAPAPVVRLDGSQQPAVAFLFPGQGTQYVNMGREVYETEPRFRQQVDECCEMLQPLLGLDLRSILYPHDSQTATATAQLQQTALTQPAIFVVEYALAQLWMSWGVRPVAALGHSIGEYVAATIAGVFSLEEALSLVAARGQLMQQLPAGKMLAVPLGEAQVLPLLDEQLSLAAVNAPNTCVVSGTKEAIENLQQRLSAQGIESRLLHTSHAFHSPMMAAVLVPFGQRVEQVRLQVPQIPFLSNVTGTWITTEAATDPSYWVKHLRHTVRFAHGLQQLMQPPGHILLEVGAGTSLSTLARRQAQASKPVVLSSLRHPQQQQSDVALLLESLGQLWLHGVKVDWQGFYRPQRRSRLPLPTYPFERQRFWVEPDPDNNRDRQLSIRNRTQTSSPNIELQNSSVVESLDDSTDALDNFTGVEDKQNFSELAIEEILDRQLDLMSQQLDFVHNIKSG